MDSICIYYEGYKIVFNEKTGNWRTEINGETVSDPTIKTIKKAIRATLPPKVKQKRISVFWNRHSDKYAVVQITKDKNDNLWLIKDNGHREKWDSYWSDYEPAFITNENKAIIAKIEALKKERKRMEKEYDKKEEHLQKSIKTITDKKLLELLN